MSWGRLLQVPDRDSCLIITHLPFASGFRTYSTLKIMNALFTYTTALFAAATLSAAVVTGGGTGTGTTTPTTPVVTPTKPTSGSCQKSESPHEKKSAEKKSAPKPAPIKSAAPACKKK
jgi:hypothetical protein